ncbi:flagellar filament capping protein FliD [Colwellia sp. 6M3]|jgi:flagellar hook-associated protein 2|uniref:flagellar filament capping protein FliD n=1 Tax=Colwellia sp. 6M3 TaxID=2759849 RepID=UPI0015F60656|nr:flagellar filament capping protein FliD [Colwellia sp. 6M3]MBA6414943.1 flagellar filament capping protein FliD [Colwellia sp. 6M3]|tara:strand:- start:1185 stop:2606 length:1422 start_codon:yes stop_codon:yes gene_type:complete
MVDIAFTGIGSGLQVSEIVDAIVGAERAPFEGRLNRRQAAITTDISAVGALKGALESVADAIDNLASADKYQQRVTSGSDSFVSLSSTKNAEVGSYSINVDQIATPHKLVSDAFGSSEAVGEGTMTLSSGSESFDINVSATATLGDIRDAINDSLDNTSISATIITDDNGQHLVLTSKETGLANAITVTVAEVAQPGDILGPDNTDKVGLSRLAYDTGATNLTEVREAKDAQITIDGSLVVTNSTNEFVDAIDGITITAKKAHDVNDDPSIAITSENNSNIKLGLEEFVTSYNALVDLSKQLGQSGESSAGPLAGDSLLRGVMSKLRQELSSSFSSTGGDSLTLNQLGVRSDRFGKFELDTDDLDAQIALNVDGVQNFFVGSDETPGFAASLKTLTEFYTESDGIIQGRIDSKNSQLSKLDDEREAFTRRIDALEARLFSQYNAMDLLVSNLNATSSYLQQQLDNLPGVVRES